MKRITVNDIMAADPCEKYTEEVVKKLWAGHETLTPEEIAKLDIPGEDRLWAIISCCLSDRQRRHFACDCAELVLSKAENPDSRSIEAIRVARLYADRKATDEQLTKAHKAACDAACDTAYDRGCYAAYDVAYTACCTACHAAYNAACSTAYKAACSATYETLLENAIKYANGGGITWKIFQKKKV